METSAKELCEKDDFQKTEEAIDFIFTTDLLQKEKYMTKDKYVITQIRQNKGDIPEGYKRLNAATLTYI